MLALVVVAFSRSQFTFNSVIYIPSSIDLRCLPNLLDHTSGDAIQLSVCLRGKRQDQSAFFQIIKIH
jgi:hypothetical protein